LGMGFEAGVSYSAEETRRKMMEAWTKADSQFKGVTEDLSGTWTGLMSMMKDKWFAFRNLVMEAGVFDELKKILSDLNDQAGRWLKTNRDLIKIKVPEYIKKIRNYLEDIWDIVSYDSAILEWGIVGLAIGGKKWGVIAAGLGHMVTWVGNLAKALGLASAGIISFSEIAKANFTELEELIKRGEGIISGTSSLGGQVRLPMPTMPETVVTATPIAPEQPLQPGPTDEQREKALEDYEAWKQMWIDIDTLRVKEAEELERHRMEHEQQMYEEGFDAWQQMEEARMVLMQENAEKEVSLREWVIEQMESLNTQGFNDFVGNLKSTFLAFSKNSKTMFALYKAVSLAQAIISGISASIEAFKNGMIAGGPYAGPAVAAAYMAASIAATGAQIAAIMSTDIGSTGQLSPGGTPATPTYPVSPDTGLPTSGTGSQGQTLVIHIEGDFIGDEAYIEMLADKITEGVEDRDVYLVASHSQYADALA